MQQLKIWIVIKQSTNLELNEPIVENAHTLTTTITGSKNSQKGVNNQTSNHNSVLCAPPPPPPQGPFLTDSWSWMKSSARHTFSKQKAEEKQPETV